MKINLPFHYHLKISKQNKPIKALLPIGCDCHPAYMLSKLGLRNESLPFDWLDTKSHLGLHYAYNVIQTKFQYFLSDLVKNDEGKVYSQKYPEALFYHFDDLIENQILQLKINERIQRFLKLYEQQACYFVYNLTSASLEQQKNLNSIIESVANFKSLLKPNDELLIYLRFDESLEENSLNVQVLKQAVQSFSQVKMIYYVREKNKFGIWGDETKYKQLVESLGIKTKWTFPKIVLKQNR